jgi:hypothetical protein
MISNLEIYDENQSVGFLKKIGIDTPAYVGDDLLRVKNVPDMVTKVLSAIGSQREKIDIFLRGVGTVNYQSVGAGAIHDDSKERSLQVDSKGELNHAAKIWLPRLLGRVRRIYLLGIENKHEYIDHNNASYSLLLAVAKVLTDVQIYGGDALILNSGESGKHQSQLRSQVERQRLRDSLKKLNRR